MKNSRAITKPFSHQAMRRFFFTAQDGQSVAEYAVAMAVVLFVSLAGLSALEGQTLAVLRRLVGLH